jgi:hypothetical protein
VRGVQVLKFLGRRGVFRDWDISREGTGFRSFSGESVLHLRQLFARRAVIPQTEISGFTSEFDRELPETAKESYWKRRVKNNLKKSRFCI